MKKIFSILFVLLMVVSLGLATTAPVLAGGDDRILTVAEMCTLTISSTAGGNVTTPGVGNFIYHVGTVVSLVAKPAAGYGFVNWAGDVGTIANVNAATTNITMQGNYNITARFLPGVVATKTQTVTNSTVDAKLEAGAEVVVKGTATVTIARYASNPHPPSGGGIPASLDLLALDTFREVNIFRDVSVTNTEPGTEIEIRLYYIDIEVAAANVSEESLRLFWWNGTAWVQCSSSGVNTTSSYSYSGYMWAEITATTTPSLANLQGTEFGGYGHPSETPQPWCFIATAAYGTATAKEIDILREFRDEVLLPNSLGSKFVSLYYKTSPPIADFISQHEVLRTVVRVGFVDPIVKMLNWSHDLWSARGS
ncbi:MAG: CFI-box-CTERM domain-containing protein [Dehalococcoidia bacterium]